MKRAVVLLAIAAMVVCIIPLVETSDAATTTDVPTGTVAGKVKADTKEPIYITDVRVTLFDLETKKDIEEATDVSDNNGYSITYNVGTYGIRFELGGYETLTDEVTITENTTTPYNAVMKETKSYFGLDLSHALMILGGTVGIVLILFAVMRRSRLH